MIEENPLKTKILPIALIGGGLVALFILLTKRAEAGEFPCPYCDKTFASLAELNAHIASAHPGQAPADGTPPEMKYCLYEKRKIPKSEWTEERCGIRLYRCSAKGCGREFHTLEACKSHFRASHPEDVKYPFPHTWCATLKHP